MKIQPEKRNVYHHWKREQGSRVHPDLLATSLVIHFALYLLFSFMLAQNQQVPSSSLAKNFHPIYLLQSIKNGNISKKVGAKKRVKKIPLLPPMTASVSPPIAPMIGPSHKKEPLAPPPPVRQKPLRMVSQAVEIQPQPTIATPVHTPRPDISKPPVRTTSPAITFNFQTAKKSDTPPIKTRIIKEEKTKTHHEVFYREKKIPTRQTRQSWTTDAPMPEMKKIVTAKLKSETKKKTVSVRKEKILKKITLNPSEYTSAAGGKVLTVPSLKPSPTLPSRKTMQLTKPVQPTKTSPRRTVKIEQIMQQQTKIIPTTKRLPHTQQINPSILPGKEEIPSKSFPTILAEKSQLQKNAPTTQTLRKKPSELLPTTAPGRATEFKVAMQIEHRVAEKNVYSPTEPQEKLTIKTKTHHETFGEKVKKINQSRLANIKVPMPKRQRNTALISNTQEVSTISSQPVRSAPITAKNPTGPRAIAAEAEVYTKTMPALDSDPTPSGRKTTGPAKTTASVKTSSPRTKIEVAQVTIFRKAPETPAKRPQLPPAIDRRPLLKKTAPTSIPTPYNPPDIPTVREEKKQQKTPTTQTAKRSPEPHPVTMTTETESRRKINIATYYQPASAPRVVKNTRSPIPKQTAPKEEKKIDKRVNIQKEPHANLAMLTPGDTQKTNIYDVSSTSIKKKKLDKKIYDSFIVPQKREKATLTSFLTNHFLNRNPVKEIMVTSKGMIWAGIEGGILKYDGSRWDFLQSSGRLPGEVVYSLAEAPDGSFWIGTDNGLVKLDRSGNSVLSSGELSGEIFDVRIDKKGTVWAGTDSGLYRYNGQTWQEVAIPKEISGAGVNSIVEDSQGRMWIGTEKGLSVYNGITWTHYDTENGLVNNNVQSLAMDTNGNLWCATENGVSRFNGKYFQSYTTADGLADNMVFTVKTDTRGNIWFGTGAGVSKFNNYKFSNYDRKNGLLGWNVHSIAIAENGEYWFGTDRGVSKMMEAN